jgi:N-acetylneuraminic acid mutarotase
MARMTEKVKHAYEGVMQIAPMKHPRRNSDAVTMNGRIYVVGGKGPDEVRRNDVEFYDPGAMKWHDLPGNLASGRSTCTVEAVGDSLYCVGGFDGSSFLNTVEPYDNEKANGLR